METTRLVQLAGVIFCLVLIISEMCYCYPPSYTSADEENNIQQGVRELLEDWERQGLIRSLVQNKAYLPRSSLSISSGRNSVRNGHEIMTRKVPRSGSNSNLRLRYGKRSNLPPFEQIRASDDVEDARASSSSAGGNENHGNWKMPSDQD